MRASTFLRPDCRTDSEDFPRPVTGATQGENALATEPTSAYCASPHLYIAVAEKM